MTMRGGWPKSGFGGRLRALRTGAGLSRRELAAKAGTHPNTIAKMEQGAQEPAWPLVLALARALGVGASEFMPGDQPPALDAADEAALDRANDQVGREEAQRARKGPRAKGRASNRQASSKRQTR